MVCESVLQMQLCKIADVSIFSCGLKVSAIKAFYFDSFSLIFSLRIKSINLYCASRMVEAVTDLMVVFV